jgi:hypothetical protein
MRVALVAVVLLGACAERAGPGAGPDDPVTGTPVAPGPSVGTLQVEPRDGLVDVRPHAWDRAEPTGPRTVRVEFYGGVEECEGLARVDVDEAPDRVTITLFTGRVPTAEVCIEIAVLKAVMVTLDAPLGERALVDGAA